MTNLYIIVFVVCAFAGALFYVRRQKKAGAACIGCPNSKECSGGCGCIGHEETE